MSPTALVFYLFERGYSCNCAIYIYLRHCAIFYYLFIYLNMTSLTLIRLSVAIVMGRVWLLNIKVINEMYFHLSNYYFCICF